MRRALDLARAGIGLVSPNPAVGAVVLDASGREVGCGTHTYDGVKHAEVLALEQAGDKARGGTLYLNLEPCSHQGRTAPCADAVIAAGIGRVVCSMEDPNPQVAGQGFAKLHAAGIKVEVGIFEAEAKKLNESFAKYIRLRKPLVTLKSAMTLDGKIADASKPGTERSSEARSATPATEGSRSGYHWITGEASRTHVQQLRHQSDAIMVGVGTVMADDPLLTDRSGRPRRRKLLRVILDSYLRVPLASRVVQTAENDVLVLCSTAEEQSRQALEAKGIRVQQIAAMADGRPDFRGDCPDPRRTGNHQRASRRWSAGERSSPGVGRGGQSVSLLRAEDFWRGWSSLYCRRKSAREGAVRRAFRVASLRRRFRPGRLFARPVLSFELRAASYELWTAGSQICSLEARGS